MTASSPAGSPGTIPPAALAATIRASMAFMPSAALRKRRVVSGAFDPVPGRSRGNRVGCRGALQSLGVLPS
jgi:hypothetical protein